MPKARLGLWIWILALLPASASAVDLGPFIECTHLENDIARLQCFDEAAAALAGGTTVHSNDDLSESDESAVPPTGVARNGDSSSSVEPAEETAPSEIIEADDKMVENCEFLGTVMGKSGWGGLAAGAASKGSLRSAKKRAAKLGATHLVAGGFRGGYQLQASTFQGRAYRCPPAP